MAGTQYGRCSDGHIFPIRLSDHVLSLHLGARRLQRCPIDKRWRMVEMIWEQDLTDEEIERASSERG